MNDNHETISRDEFDRLTREDQFADGPYIEAFGDGYGEPYQPNRTMFGTLKDGREVKSSTGGDCER